MKWYNPTEEQRINWRRNVLNLPVDLQRLAQAHPPWNLYRLESTGQCVYVTNIAENGKFRVTASRQHNTDQPDDESLNQIDHSELRPAAFLVAPKGSAIEKQLESMKVGILGAVYQGGQVLEFPKKGPLRDRIDDMLREDAEREKTT